MSASYFYARLRGDSPFDTNDIERLASALGTHPHEISRVAASLDETDDDIEPRVELDRAELARRVVLLMDSPLTSGEDADEEHLVSLLEGRGVAIEESELDALRDASSTGPVKTRVLETLAEYVEVPPAYLLDFANDEARDAAEAQVEFRSALRASGASSIAARAVGDVSPAALRAIAESLRSLST